MSLSHDFDKFIIFNRKINWKAKDLKEYNKIYPEYFKDPQPTRSTIVNVLPTFLKFELDCVAYVPNTRQEG